MGNKFSSCVSKPKKQGIKAPDTDGLIEMNGAEINQEVVADKQDQQNDDVSGEEDDEEQEKDQNQAKALNLLKAWFRSFHEETDADRRGVLGWARNCLWRYFWDFILQKKFNTELDNIRIWGRKLQSVYKRLQHIRRLAEYTLKRMDKKNKEKVFLQLTQFSDLQGPDIFWDEDLRIAGLDALNHDDNESLDDIKVLTSHFGTLAIDLFPEPNFPVRGKWISMNYTGNLEDMTTDNQESSDFVILTLSKEGWEDLKLITQVNNLPRIRRIRAARQKIRMLHAQPVKVLMKNCLRCSAPMIEGVSTCFVNGNLQFNDHVLHKAAHEIIDYSSAFTFKVIGIDPNSIARCGKRCQGNASPSIKEIDPDQFFIGSLLQARLPPTQITNWEAALRRRRTCGLSFHFYTKVYASKELPTGDFESWRTAVQSCEGVKSDLYTQLFETQPAITKLVHELHKRIQYVCTNPERAYWFKFWVTAIKAVFPDGKIPDDKWDFDFVVNHKAICYTIMERESVDELVKKSKIFDNATLYLSKNHSISNVLNILYKNLQNLKRGYEDTDEKNEIVPDMQANGESNNPASKATDTTTTQASTTAATQNPQIPTQSLAHASMPMMGMPIGTNADGTPMASYVVPTTTIIVGNTAQNTHEYNEMAQQSQEVMSRLLAIQADVLNNGKSREAARLEMAALALQYPILLNAIGGINSVDALKANAHDDRRHKNNRRSKHYDSDDSDNDNSDDSDDNGNNNDDELEYNPKSSAKKSNRKKGKDGKKNRKGGDDASDESDNDLEAAYSKISGSKPKQEIEENYGFFKMQAANMKQRMCTSVEQNGVNLEEKVESGEPDACTIM